MTTRAWTPAGVFDSDLGGLSILCAIHAELPVESSPYLADSRHALYGGKPPELIAEHMLRVRGWLIDRGCKVLVIVCNTATVQAVHVLREKLAVPVIGIESGLKPVVVTLRSHVVGMLVTENTLRSEKSACLLTGASGDHRILSQPGYGLVPLIERGDTHSSVMLELLRAYLRPMLGVSVDTLVPGCTRYPLLKDAIHETVGDRLTSINTERATVCHLGHTLVATGLRASGQTATPCFISTGGVLPLQAMMVASLEEAPMIQWVDIGDAPLDPIVVSFVSQPE